MLSKSFFGLFLTYHPTFFISWKRFTLVSIGRIIWIIIYVLLMFLRMLIWWYYSIIPCKLRYFSILMSKNTISMFLILEKISLIFWTICPFIHSISMFKIITVFSLILISIFLSRRPPSFPIPHTILEKALIYSSIIPRISSSSFKFSIFILSLIDVSVFEMLSSISKFKSIIKISLKALHISKDQFSEAMLFSFLPLSLIPNSIIIKLLAFSMLNSIRKLPDINRNSFWSNDLDNTWSASFPWLKMPFINEFSIMILQSFSWFFSLSIQELFPSSVVNSSFVV